MSKYPVIECDDCEVEMEGMKEVLYKSEDTDCCYRNLSYWCPKCGRVGILTICYKECDSGWEWVK